MDHVENAYSSITRYYDILEKTGYYPEYSMKSLMVYSFLVGVIMEGPLQSLVNDADLPILRKVLSCIEKNSCLVAKIRPMQRVAKPRENYSDSVLRIVNKGDLRSTELSNLRETETNV